MIRALPKEKKVYLPFPLELFDKVESLDEAQIVKLAWELGISPQTVVDLWNNRGHNKK